MTSPPQYQIPALSPPYSTTYTLPPIKRRQTELPSSAPASKRRKASMLSITSTNTNSSHPLRQTSFPAQTPQDPRSPSVDTMSLVSGSAAGGKPKRARKSRSKRANTTTTPGDDASTPGFEGGKSGISEPSTRGRGRRTRDQSTEDEDPTDPYALDMNTRMVMESAEEKLKASKDRAMLVRKMDPEQTMRYEAWRSSKLSDATVRRLINQTTSQSVPQQVILAIKTVAKLYAGEIIEEARKVQSQWVEAEARGNLPSPPAEDGDVIEVDRTKAVEKRRGPLEPDHLREALRRYRLTREGGLPGNQEHWTHQHKSGAERFGIMSLGKRLMK